MKIGFFSKCLSAMGVALLLGAILLLDWMTGYEFSIFPLYFIPVILGALVFGRSGGFVYAVMTVIGRFAVDAMDGHPYSRNWLRYEHGAMQLIVFSAVVVVFDGYRRTLDAHRRRLAALEKLLIVCPACGRLAGGDGNWYNPADYREMLNKEMYCVCPECAAKRTQT